MCPTEPTSPSQHFLSGKNISPSLQHMTCKQPDTAFAACFCVSLSGSCECQVCTVTGFLFPLVSGTSCSQRDAEQTNGPLFPKVTSCFPTHLQRHFPFPGLARRSSSLCQKGGRGRCFSFPSSQSSFVEGQRLVSLKEANRGGGSSWVRSPCVPFQMCLSSWSLLIFPFFPYSLPPVPQLCPCHSIYLVVTVLEVQLRLCSPGMCKSSVRRELFHL